MRTSQQKLSVRPFRSVDQSPARRLILEGLGEHFGWIDESRNRDVDDIAASYVHPGHAFVVAEIDGKVVATGGLLVDEGGVGRIVRVSVDRRYRRRGIARAIVERLIDIARRRGLGRLLAGTNDNWWPAIGLYKGCGFVEYARDDVSVYMRLDLNSENRHRRGEARRGDA